MTQANRILGHRLIELGACGSALLEHQRFVASECAQPIPGRSLARGQPQVAQQVANGAASLNGDSGGSGGSFAKMDVRIDEAGSDGASRQLDQMSLRPDQRFQLRERTVRGYQAAGDRDRITAGMAEDQPFVQNEVGFPGRGYHFGTYAFAAGDRTQRRGT
jgi:hypothetical protein